MVWARDQPSGPHDVLQDFLQMGFEFSTPCYHKTIVDIPFTKMSTIMVTRVKYC